MNEKVLYENLEYLKRKIGKYSTRIDEFGDRIEYDYWLVEEFIKEVLQDKNTMK